MIDPIKMTDYNRPDSELEEAILFCISAAGHNAISSAKALDKFLNLIAENLKISRNDNSPFKLIRVLLDDIPFVKWDTTNTKLCNYMKQAGIGCNSYKCKGRTFHELAFSNLDLRTCSVEDLEKIHGIGLKTSRFFIVHNRPDSNYAILDTHVLHYMRDNGFDVPKNTPSNIKIYKKIEQQFLELSSKSGQTQAAFDLDIWLKYSSHDRKI